MGFGRFAVENGCGLWFLFFRTDCFGETWDVGYNLTIENARFLLWVLVGAAAKLSRRFYSLSKYCVFADTSRTHCRPTIRPNEQGEN